MEQALANTNEQTDSVLSRAKQNFVPSSKQLVKDTIEMITNPVQTAKSLYELGSGIVQLAIPGEQGNEDTARAVGQHFADRYGSIEKAKETFATDPAAFALDALGVITGGAALGVGVAKAGAKAVSKVGRKVDVDDGPQPRGTTTSNDLWSSPNQKISSADTSINSSKLPQGYNTLKKENVFKEGDVVLDIGGGKFDNAVKDLSKSNVEVKIYDPFNRSPEHNKSVVDKVKDGQVDKVVSFNTLNVIPEEINRLKVVKQAHNALKDKGQAFFTVYEKKGLAGNTNKGYQTSMSTKEYIPLIESVFGEGSVTLKNKVIRAEKKGGTIMGLAAGGIATPGIAKGDGLKDPSILSPKDAKTKAAAADIKKKISGVAKKPQQGNTNIQTAMLLEPEKLLAKYKKPITPPPNVLAANEGAMPVVEEKFIPSDYFKTEMMGQWLFAEGSTGDKDGQETNQAFKGIHIDSYPEFAEEIRQGTLTDEKVAEIMYRQYTGQNVAEGKPSKFRNLSLLETVSPEAAKLLFMDAGYTGQNAGAIKDLQEYLVSKNKKIEVDGLLGEDTLEVMNDFNADEYRNYLGTLDRYTGEKGSRVYNRFFTEEERQSLNLYEKELTTMASGGVIDIQKFMDGGLADNTDDTPGATESEVADDIPAMISEGELVVPANVVRYHGLSKYENMRKTALNALDELEDNGQIRPVDSDGTPVVKDVKEQTDEVMASKGATVARYNEGGSPTIEEEPKTNFPRKDEMIIGPLDPDLTKDLKPVGPRVTTREGQTITPDDSGNKATLTTPEGKNYRVTNPNTKITATGPRTTGIVGGNYTGVDLENMPGFGVDRSGGSAPSGPNTVEKILSGVTTIAALDKLFLDGKITDKVLKWGKENIFDPLGEFLGFKPEVFKAGPLAGSSIVNGQLMLADGTMDIVTSLSGADVVGKAVADGTVIGANSWLNGIPANAEIVTTFSGGLNNPTHTAVFKDANGATQSVELTNAQKLQLESGNAIGTPVSSGDGLFSWKGGLATIGTALSLYDLIENGPSITNVAGTAAGVGGMINAGVFGLSTTAGFGATGLGQALSLYATPLALVALAAGLVEAFSGPPSNKVAEAAINFDNPEYKESDILVGGFWTKKRSDENIDAVTQLSASIGSYVSSMEQALEINIGGELFLDVGTTRGLRYGYVDGYDELGMYKYHKKDLDYKLLSGQGQTGKGYRGEDAVTDLMNDIQDDTNVVVMFALADKAAGGEGYATYDNVPLYRKKINTLSTYKSGLAGSGTKAVLTDQERNLLEGFQKKEFAAVTGEELAALLPIYDKIAPVQQDNNFNFNSLVI